MAVSDPTQSTYFYDLLDAVQRTYGLGDQWQKIAQHTATPEEMYNILKQTNGVSIVTNKNNEVVSWTVDTTVFNKSSSAITDIGNTANSNLVPATSSSTSLTTVKVPAYSAIEEGEFTEIRSGATKYYQDASGVEQSTNANVVAGQVMGAVAGAASLAQLGFTVTEKLYEKYPDFFETNNLQIFSPQAWNEIASSGTKFGDVINVLFFGDDETTEAANKNKNSIYLEDKALAYMALYAASKGIYDPDKNYTLDSGTIESSGVTANVTVSPRINYGVAKNAMSATFSVGGSDYNALTYKVTFADGGFGDIYYWSWYDYSTTAVSQSVMTTREAYIYRKYSRQDDSHYNLVAQSSAGSKKPLNNIYRPSLGGYSILPYQPETAFTPLIGAARTDDELQIKSTITFSDGTVYKNNNELAVAALLANNFTKTVGGVEGIDKQVDATQANVSSATDVDSMLSVLKNTYPELWQNRIESKVVQPDGSNKTFTYLPVPMPTGGSGAQPTTEGATQNNSTLDPESDDATDKQIATSVQPFIGEAVAGIISSITPTITTNPDPTGEGDTPAIIIPTGTANALWSIYNPTLAQVQSLGGFLWSSNFIDQLLKMFTSPMEAVISLHKIFATPSINGAGEIKVGYLSTGVTDVNLVNKQYITVECGSVDLPEYFGNVLDYKPFTNISLYLPFIGIVTLNTADVLRSTISVTYQIDVLTGACLAQVNVKRDASGGVLYQYTGSCAVEYPLSAGTYLGAVSNVLAGVVSGGVRGGSLFGEAGLIGGALIGGVTGAMNGGVDYPRSGNFSGNAGAMAIKKPYLIISRPQAEIADTFPRIDGYPTNYSTTVGACSGYIEVEGVHVENINATEDELIEIETLLKSGVLV